MAASDAQTGTSYRSATSIFTPTSASTAASPTFRCTNRSITPASRKNMARIPSTANAFDVNTRNGSVVTAKIAGIESTAKATSTKATARSTTSIGVASSRPRSRTRSRPPR